MLNSWRTATIDRRPGGVWKFVITKNDEKKIGFEGDYLDLQNGKRLAFTWAQMIIHAEGDATLPAEIQVDLSAWGGDGKQAFNAVSDWPRDVIRRSITAIGG